MPRVHASFFQFYSIFRESIQNGASLNFDSQWIIDHGHRMTRIARNHGDKDQRTSHGRSQDFGSGGGGGGGSPHAPCLRGRGLPPSPHGAITGGVDIRLIGRIFGIQLGQYDLRIELFLICTPPPIFGTWLRLCEPRATVHWIHQSLCEGCT